MLLGGERKREFAVLRVIGVSRKRLSGIALKEALLVSVLGGLIGISLSLLIVLNFHSLIEKTLALPFLLPSGRNTMLFAVSTLACVCIAGPLSAMVSALKLSRADTGILLREGV